MHVPKPSVGGNVPSGDGAARDTSGGSAPHPSVASAAVPRVTGAVPAVQAAGAAGTAGTAVGSGTSPAGATASGPADPTPDIPATPEPLPATVHSGTSGTPSPAAAVPAGPVTRRELREARKRGPRLFRRSRRPPREPGAPSRAGRNLPAAIGVGVGLMILVLGGLLFFPLAFVALVTVLGVLGVLEVSRALAVRRIGMPLVPAVAASVALPLAAYYGGAESLAFASVFSFLALLLWRSLDPAPGAPRAVMAGAFTLLWVPFMLSFAMLLLQLPGGYLLIATLLLLVVANDTFGYLIGVLFGKHPMAPKISPKKSWEGFGGSVGGAMVIGALCAVFLLDQPLWVGLVLAVAIVAAATAGDLAESMIKRELGVKDMGTMLPGHGGVMDRLDSVVFASPMAFLLSATLVPGLI
ncbi:phosphatidate cytidylyltransferase [Arthrobacter frigidicola]|nr:phosphatidate cytidylyltransferase [Arthrobacter frigidicola]